jgi:hypothetical protein
MRPILAGIVLFRRPLWELRSRENALHVTEPDSILEIMLLPFIEDCAFIFGFLFINSMMVKLSSFQRG